VLRRVANVGELRAHPRRAVDVKSKDGDANEKVRAQQATPALQFTAREKWEDDLLPVGNRD
jgi:hypothetical protein